MSRYRDRSPDDRDRGRDRDRDRPSGRREEPTGCSLLFRNVADGTM